MGEGVRISHFDYRKVSFKKLCVTREITKENGHRATLEWVHDPTGVRDGASDMYCASCLALPADRRGRLSSRDLNAKNAAEERAIKAKMDGRPQKF